MKIIFNIKKIHLLKILLLITLSVFTIVCITIPFLRLNINININYVEGFNAYHTLDFINFKPVYLKNLTPLNYPPLSYLIIAALSFIFPDPLIIGRYLSFVSLIFISILILYILKKMNLNSSFCYIASLSCLMIFSTIAYGYVGMNDPQLLGESFLLLAFYIYSLKVNQKDNLTIILVLITLGLFIKHNLISIPIAIMFDLFLISFRRGLILSIKLAFTLLFFLLIIQILSQNNFIYSLTLPRSYYFYIPLNYFFLLLVLLPGLIPIFIFFPALFKTYRLISLYFIFSLLLGLFFSGGEGTNINMFFDLFISYSLLVGILISQFKKNSQIITSQPLLLFSIAIFILNLSTFLIIEKGIIINFQSLQSDEKLFKDDVLFIKSIPGNAICENLLLCYYSQKSFNLESYNSKILFDRKIINEEETLTHLNDGSIPLIQIDLLLSNNLIEGSLCDKRNNISYTRFTKNFLCNVSKNYHLARSSPNSYIYLYNNQNSK